MLVVVWTFFVALAAFVMVDHFQTVALIQAGYEEANPIVLWIIGEKMNWLNLFGFKTTMLMIVAALLFYRTVQILGEDI